MAPLPFPPAPFFLPCLPIMYLFFSAMSSVLHDLVWLACDWQAIAGDKRCQGQWGTQGSAFCPLLQPLSPSPVSEVVPIT